MSKNSKLKWERVHNFGRHAHIIRNGKTFCGRDISMYVTEVQKNPTKKCRRCLDLAYVENLPELKIIKAQELEIVTT